MEWLNYHHLLYFWTVAREGGLAPAGKVLRLSQSALSGQIKTLEDSLGHALFERRGRKLELTEIGRVVLRYADDIFGTGRELLDFVRGRALRRTPKLVVGISDVVPKLLVRQLLAPVFLQPEPVSLTCVEDRFDRLLADLSEHVVDVVIADGHLPPDASVRAFNHLLGESTMTFVAPRGHAAGLRRGFPRSLEGRPILLPLTGTTLRRNLAAWFDAHELRPHVVAEAEDSALLAAFAADGMGGMFVPTVIAPVLAKRYNVVAIAEVADLRERYYAISAERRLVHPAVIAIRAAARSSVFA